MTKPFTASEVRDAIAWKYGDKSTRISAMLNAFADLLEAREKAVPVMVVNHVSSAEHDLPIGMKLYTHPSPADAERLAEALRDAEATVLAFLGDVAFDGSVCGIKQAIVKGMFARLQAHAAEAAQAQAQAAEPVAITKDSDDLYTGWLSWTGKELPPGTKLYTNPQPAKDASKYQELLMAVEKKFPGESRHETALRYIRETELQSCEPKCDAAMAKESGR